MDTYHRWIEIHIFASLFYLPSISLPIGFNKDGFPIGIQIIAKEKEDLKEEGIDLISIPWVEKDN